MFEEILSMQQLGLDFALDNQKKYKLKDEGYLTNRFAIFKSKVAGSYAYLIVRTIMYPESYLLTDDEKTSIIESLRKDDELNDILNYDIYFLGIGAKRKVEVGEDESVFEIGSRYQIFTDFPVLIHRAEILEGYGYSQCMPIECNNVSEIYSYLEKMKYKKGYLVSYERIASFEAENGLIDKFVLLVQKDGLFLDKIVLWFDGYSKIKKWKLPKNFKF